MTNVIPLRGKRADCQNEGFSSPEGEPYLTAEEAERSRLKLISNCKARIAADAQLILIAGSKQDLISYLGNLYDHFQGYGK